MINQDSDNAQGNKITQKQVYFSLIINHLDISLNSGLFKMYLTNYINVIDRLIQLLNHVLSPR